jgi:hypothetical protein
MLRFVASLDRTNGSVTNNLLLMARTAWQNLVGACPHHLLSLRVFSAVGDVEVAVEGAASVVVEVAITWEVVPHHLAVEVVVAAASVVIGEAVIEVSAVVTGAVVASVVIDEVVLAVVTDEVVETEEGGSVTGENHAWISERDHNASIHYWVDRTFSCMNMPPGCKIDDALIVGEGMGSIGWRFQGHRWPVCFHISNLG